jgi:hypothetical protein
MPTVTIPAASRVVAAAALCLLLGAAPAVAAVTILLVNQDPPGTGLNDPTPFSPVGGNSATTLGQARLNAVQFAASLWAQYLSSDVTIRVGVQFQAMGGSTNSAILGIGGAADVYRDFANAPVAGTYYAAALADKLAGVDLSGGNDLTINLTFNSDVDGPVVLGTSSFYYGFDGHPASGDVNFVEVAAHELANGLGFATYLDLHSGAKLLGYNDAFMLHLESDAATPSDFPSMTDAQRLAAVSAAPAVHWTGSHVAAAAAALTAGATPDGRVEIYAPLASPVDPRSPLNHFNTSLVPPNMQGPVYSAQGAALDFNLVLAALADEGWDAPPGCVTAAWLTRAWDLVRSALAGAAGGPGAGPAWWSRRVAHPTSLARAG